jgi:hypothetical protein
MECCPGKGHRGELRLIMGNGLVVYYANVVPNRKLFSWFRNFPDCELADSSDLNQLVQQEVFIPGVLHVPDNRKEPLPLFLPAQTAFAQYDQSRMNRRVEKFDEVSCVRRDHREVMIERILPDHMIRPTCEANVRYGLRIHTEVS